MATLPDHAAGEALTSRDGTRIAHLSLGAGPDVIVVPGALSVSADYLAFARALAPRFTVHVIERRGRGQSGPQGDRYGIDREVEDLLALRQRTGARLLVGHSYGGLVALQAARGNAALAAVAVYEPGVSVEGSIPTGWMDAFERHLAEGRELDAFIDFTRAFGPRSARLAPRWWLRLLMPRVLGAERQRHLFALLPQCLREHREVARMDGSFEGYREVSARVLLMRGGRKDTAWARLAMERLRRILPRAEARVFPGLDHFGIDQGGPEEVARAVAAFLAGPDGG